MIFENPEYDGFLILDDFKYNLLFLLIVVIAIAFINFLSV